jgi:hypothetical protein
MGPIRAFHKHVRQNGGNQIAWCVFVEQRDSVDSFEMQRQLGPRALVEKGACGAFEPLDAGVGVQGKNENIAERAGTLEQTNVAGMQNVITAISKYDLFGFRFPGATLREKFGTSVELAHSRFYFTIARLLL